MKTLRPTTNTTTTVLTCPADAILRLRTIYVANTATVAHSFTLTITRGAGQGGGAFAMHAGVTVAAKNLFNATTIDDAIYLEEGDSISFAQSALVAALNLFISYELVT